MPREKQAHMRRLSITLPDEYVAGLEDLAEDLGGSVSEAVREAIATYLMENYWKESIGGVAREAILEGLTNEEALKAVKDKFPRSATSPASIQWYRSKLRRELGAERVQTDRQARAVRSDDLAGS